MEGDSDILGLGDSDLLDLISERLGFEDFLRFRCVSTSWFKSTQPHPVFIKQTNPLLIMKPQPYRVLGRWELEDTILRKLYDCFENKTLAFSLPDICDQPTITTGTFQAGSKVASYKRICGSCFGWLAIVGSDGLATLLNPLTKEKVALPSLATFPGRRPHDASIDKYHYVVERLALYPLTIHYLQKVILSSPPKKEKEWYAFALGGSSGTFANNTGIRGDVIAIFKSGTDQWSHIHSTTDTLYSAWKDILYADGYFYAINCKGVVLRCTGEGVKTIIIPSPQFQFYQFKQNCHLVNVNGDIVLVTSLRKLVRDEKMDKHIVKTCEFILHRLDCTDIPTSRWVKIDSLGDSIVFLGTNAAICCSAANLPRCTENSIYFFDLFSFDETFERCSVPNWMLHYSRALVYTFSGNALPQEIELPIISKDWPSMPEPIWFNVGIAGGDMGEAMPDAAEGAGGEITG